MNAIKLFKLIIVVFFLLFYSSISAQKLTQSQLEKEKIRVRLFSFKEIDSLQLKFQDRVSKMYLKDELEEEYLYIVTANLVNMGTLDDLDKNYTKEEIITKIPTYIQKINSQSKLILTPNQYKIHLLNIKMIDDAIMRKLLTK